MALCPSCGTDNHESLTECMYCGDTLHANYRKPIITNASGKSSIDGRFIIYCIIAFSVPIAGFFLYRAYSGTREGKIILFLAGMQLLWSVLTSFIQTTAL